ncbi:NADPH-dependent F420 reductase [Anaeromyxobacter oryzae]|uniref:NADP oxidoreductase n=1 Tax=Anaeromyxobacter oryzae TaxID=2918170 RepID=A0ABN6MNW8_9BACT|nr:NAD(P)-binding domain-containing protein [Anaeromyxobacter oryzae]BDG02742.1 NADP oxidoreductase [Anaeromyxobacter oryzae]
MKIGIIGAGHIGGTAARLFVEAGHEVSVSNSRGPDSLRDLAAALGSKAHAATVDDAAAFGEVILLATPWRKPEALPSPARVAGKVVIDAMNPYTATGGLQDLGTSTSSEETAKRLPGARLVKAFNTIYFEHLATRGRRDLPVEERHAIFVAGDDAAAKRVVETLIEQIGFAPVDTGSLREGGQRQQPGTAIYNRPMTGAEARAALARGG